MQGPKDTQDMLAFVEEEEWPQKETESWWVPGTGEGWVTLLSPENNRGDGRHGE